MTLARPSSPTGCAGIVAVAVACQATGPSAERSPSQGSDPDTATEDAAVSDPLATDVWAHAVSSGAGPTRLATVEGGQIWIRTASADGWGDPIEGPAVEGTSVLAFGSYRVSDAGADVLSWEERHSDESTRLYMAVGREGSWTRVAVTPMSDDATESRTVMRAGGSTERQLALVHRDADTIGMAWVEENDTAISLWYAEHSPDGWSPAERVRTLVDGPIFDGAPWPASLSPVVTDTGVAVSVGLFSTVNGGGFGALAAAQVDGTWEESRSEHASGEVRVETRPGPYTAQWGGWIGGAQWQATGQDTLWSLDDLAWIRHDVDALAGSETIHVQAVGERLAVLSTPDADAPGALSVLVGRPPGFEDAAPASLTLPESWEHARVLFGSDEDGLAWVAASEDTDGPLLAGSWSAASGHGPVREIPRIPGSLAHVIRVGDGWELLSYDSTERTLEHNAL